ncbi:MAG TPA: hypothetical protein VK518_07495 [Puia sp.]|nr:hypothetical protein [Puia sp.]
MEQRKSEHAGPRDNITLKEFEIDFSFQDIEYIGLVTPIDKTTEIWYSIRLESSNQEIHVEIIAKPSPSQLEDWDFTCNDGNEAIHYYDQDLLVEIGEAIEKYLIDPS